jgi:hypothetical protein
VEEKSLSGINRTKARLKGEKKVAVEQVTRQLMVHMFFKKFAGYWKKRDGTIVRWSGMVFSFV